MDNEMTMDVVFVEELLDRRGWNWARLIREMGVNKSTMNRVVRLETLPGRKFIFALIRVFSDEDANRLFTEVWRARMERGIEQDDEEPAA
jgi:hypothetical protein